MDLLFDIIIFFFLVTLTGLGIFILNKYIKKIKFLLIILNAVIVAYVLYLLGDFMHNWLLYNEINMYVFLLLVVMFLFTVFVFYFAMKFIQICEDKSFLYLNLFTCLFFSSFFLRGTGGLDIFVVSSFMYLGSCLLMCWLYLKNKFINS